MSENTILLLVAIAQSALAIPSCWIALRDLFGKRKAKIPAPRWTLTWIVFAVLTWSAVAINYQQAASGNIDFAPVDKRWAAYEYKIVSGKR